MPPSHECPSPELLSRLLQNGLPSEERGEALLHIANCNECALEYALCTSMMAEQTEHGDCPAPETLALLIEDKLSGEEKTDVLRHIAECDECAMTCDMACGMAEEAERKKERKTVDIVPYLLRLSKAAAIVLLVGVSFAGGMFYSGARSSRVLEEEYGASVEKFELSPSYWEGLNNFVWQKELRIGASKGWSSDEETEPRLRPVREIWAQKQDFDLRLYRIASLSGRDADAILSVEAVDIPSMSSKDLEMYAALLKNNREKEMETAKRWIRLDQSLYLSLADRLPSEVWERYPVSRESFDVLAWAAALSPDLKEKFLELSPEEAAREKQRGYLPYPR
ncbi:MAG: hypothetical protein LBG12_04110 [Synergistaceae bacterium]|jgi:hypothetical protein|nr:hypothetical protein [Synergistaceae bacterium]